VFQGWKGRAVLGHGSLRSTRFDRDQWVSSLGPGAFILRGVEEAASIDSSRAAMFSSSRLQTWEGAMIGRASLLLSLCIFASVAWAVTPLQQQER
jgi:hypothetical protein